MMLNKILIQLFWVDVTTKAPVSFMNEVKLKAISGLFFVGLKLLVNGMPWVGCKKEQNKKESKIMSSSKLLQKL